MAKGIKSKRMQKFKAMKREVVRRTVDSERLQRLGVPEYTKKNAFLYPNDIDAVFPQRKPKIGMDFRSEAIAPFDTIVKSTRLFEQRAPYIPVEQLKGRAVEIPEINLWDLGNSLKSIEKGMNKKQSMKLD
jgi:hypothetical protein